MRTALVSFAFFVIGCGGTDQPAPMNGASVDMAQAGSGGGGGGGGGGSGGSVDMSHAQSSTDMAHASVGDMARGGDLAGLKPFGATCSANAQCQSDVCFMGGMMSFCSMHCTPATVATDCPVPPTNGICNNQGYCK